MAWTASWHRLRDASSIIMYLVWASGALQEARLQRNAVIEISLAQKFQNLWPRESLGFFAHSDQSHSGTFYAHSPSSLRLRKSPLSCFAWTSPKPIQPSPTHTVNKMSHGGHAHKLELPVPSPEKRAICSCLSDERLGILISKLKIFLTQ